MGYSVYRAYFRRTCAIFIFRGRPLPTTLSSEKSIFLKLRLNDINAVVPTRNGFSLRVTAELPDPLIDFMGLKLQYRIGDLEQIGERINASLARRPIVK
jgi:hypothetical protein